MLKYPCFLAMGAALCCATATASAQDWDGGYEASGSASSTGETSGQTAGSTASSNANRGSGGDSGWKIAMQGRLQTLTIFSGAPDFALIPTVTPGVRLLEDRLFVGLGVEWGSISDGGPKGFGISPTMNFDLINKEYAALYGVGIVTLGTADSDFRFGANVGLGIRAKVHPAFSIGTEWGWGLHVIENGPFAQGVFGTLVFETAIPI